MKRTILTLILVVLSSLAMAKKSIVYMTREISGEGVLALFSMFESQVAGNVGIKVHFGEEGNRNFLKPELIKPLTLKLGATLIETNVLYVSKRRYTETHIELARQHGFDFAPIDILDSGGDSIIPASTGHFKEVHVGSHLNRYQTLIIFSHFKGHGMSGFGGAIKNVSMGLASIAGKMAMHASAIPGTSDSKCIKCKRCVGECPGGAITINPIRIDSSKCIGCGKCIGECPVQAFDVPWSSTSNDVFMERLVDYAKVISEGRNVIYINVLANISKSCDCAKHAPLPFMPDIGILASTDIVAIEEASHDLVNKGYDCDDTFRKVHNVSGKKQIDYACKMGMGSKRYKLVAVDSK